jgi:hypothetical protein
MTCNYNSEAQTKGELVGTSMIRCSLLIGLWLASAGDSVAGPPMEGDSVARIKADVRYLASDRLEGRGVSTPGIEVAAQYIRARFQQAGLKSGVPDGSYFQSFEYRPATGSARTTLRNVIGVLSGRGELADETIVIGGHYDHLGHGQLDADNPKADARPVHPGADDNASGVAATLELARRFTARIIPPSRRMVFLAFSGEESGRIGSRHYTLKDPIFPIKDTVAMINFDMVGRLRDHKLGIAGNESAKNFNRILTQADERSPLELLLGGPEYPGDSDHASFAEVRVPILYICTGSHEDRHTPADTADKVNYEGVKQVVDLCEGLLDRLLVAPRPIFVPPPH